MKPDLETLYAYALLVLATPFVAVGLVLAYMTQACAYMTSVLTRPALKRTSTRVMEEALGDFDNV